MASPSELAQRVTELEIKLAFADDTVQALSAADVDQYRRIVSLERTVLALRQEMATLRADASHDAHSEPPPPHY